MQRNETTSDSLSQRKEEETFQKPLLSSFDSKKSSKEKSVILENSKESAKNIDQVVEAAAPSTSSRSEASTPTLPKNSSRSLKRIPSRHESAPNSSSQKNLKSEKEIQSMVQLLKESVGNAIEQKVQSNNINTTAKNHSDSLQLYEWSGYHDEHTGILNNHEISEILPNMLLRSSKFFIFGRNFSYSFLKTTILMRRLFLAQILNL